jgi:mRNA interferase MazF
VTEPPIYRGQVWWAETPWGRKPWLIVGNNRLNRAFSEVVAVRITTTVRHAHHPEAVALVDADPLVGVVHTATITSIPKAQLLEPAGALSPPTMRAVARALTHTLVIRPDDLAPETR